jgi:hypothetical protein
MYLALLTPLHRTETNDGDWKGYDLCTTIAQCDAAIYLDDLVMVADAQAVEVSVGPNAALDHMPLLRGLCDAALGEHHARVHPACSDQKRWRMCWSTPLQNGRG